MIKIVMGLAVAWFLAGCAIIGSGLQSAELKGRIRKEVLGAFSGLGAAAGLALREIYVAGVQSERAY